MSKRVRRTQAQIYHDEYCAMVDAYKYFLYDIERKMIVVGYELREDCKQEQEDNDSKSYTTILSKKQAAKICDIEQVLINWKKA